MSKRPTVCGVQVHTWGTSYGGGNGVWAYVKRLLYGVNVGHAAMTLTIPNNSKSSDLIAKYCVDEGGKTIIPYSRNTIKFSNDAVEDVYTIYFSTWKSGGEGVLLANNIAFDRNDLWKVTDFQWNDKIKSQLQIQQKTVKSFMGAYTLSMGPLTIEHYGDVGKMKYEKMGEVKQTAEYFRLEYEFRSFSN